MLKINHNLLKVKYSYKPYGILAVRIVFVFKSVHTEHNHKRLPGLGEALYEVQGMWAHVFAKAKDSNE